MVPENDEFTDARAAKSARLRRGSVWLVSLITIGLLIGLMIGRIVHPPARFFEPQSDLAQLRQVSPSTEDDHLRLTLTFDRQPASFEMTQQAGAVLVRLGGVQVDAPMQGQVEGPERFSWQLRQAKEDAHLLFVPLSGGLDVIHTAQTAASGWQLSLDVKPAR
ncbi:hypothetical protein [Pseudomonas sp. Marseille-QA0892]